MDKISQILIKIQKELNKGKSAPWDREIFNKITNIILGDITNFKKRVEEEAMKKEEGEREYLIMSLESLYLSLVKRKYEERVDDNFYILYKYSDHYKMFLAKSIGEEGVEKVLEKIREIGPEEIIFLTKDQKKKESFLGCENWLNSSEKMCLPLTKLIKPGICIRLTLPKKKRDI